MAASHWRGRAERTAHNNLGVCKRRRSRAAAANDHVAWLCGGALKKMVVMVVVGMVVMAVSLLVLLH